MDVRAWRAEFERGRTAGEADRLAGRSLETSDDVDGAYGPGVPFARGWHAGHEPQEPRFPAPLALNLALAALNAAMTDWSRRAHGVRDWRLRAVLLVAPLVAGELWIDRSARRRRARRAGAVRAGDGPPQPPAAGVIAFNLATTFTRRWDAKRRGAWPPSGWTAFATQVPYLVRAELRWRRWARAWEASGPPHADLPGADPPA